MAQHVARARQLRALILDFDGLIVDTESSLYQAWCEQYAVHGLSLSLERWAPRVGADHRHFDPCADLTQQLGAAMHATLTADVEARHHALCGDRDALPGVRALIARARELGLPIAVASSSSRGWIDRHLARIGLAHHITAIASRDDIARIKPDPEVYLRAAYLLGVPPEQCLAVEDSANGVRAAKAAGMFCIAVPNQVTAILPLHEADLVLASLADATLDLLLSRLGLAPPSSDARAALV